MKKLTYFGAFLMLVGFTVISCEKEVKTGKSEQENTSSISVEGNELDKKPVIYYATWDEWGRASKKCDGWGLCNFEDCWFCDDGTPSYRAPVTVVNPITGKAFMSITLDPNDKFMAEAIKTKEDFYVDQDIVNKIATIHAGAYKYTPSIGKYGGYKLRVTVNL